MLPALGLTPILDDDLQELRVGPEADGLSREEYIRRFGWVDIINNPFTPVDPGGESWSAFMVRVGSTLDRIAQEHEGKTVVIVCHGGVVDGSFVHFFGMDPHTFPKVRFHTENTSLAHWERTPLHGGKIWRLASYNDICHLRGLEALSDEKTEQPAAPVPTESIT